MARSSGLGLAILIGILALGRKPRKLTVNGNGFNGNGYVPSDDTQDEEQQEQDIVAPATTQTTYVTLIKKYPEIPIPAITYGNGPGGGGGRIPRLFT